MTIPRRIKKSGTQFKGLSMRELAIAVAGLAGAILIAMLLPVAVWLKAGLAVLVAAVALVLAFGTYQGQKAEQLIGRWIQHRFLRPTRMVWRRGGEDLPDVEVEFPEERGKREPLAPAAPAAAGSGGVVVDRVPLIYGLVNAIILSAMTSITVYLANGGAEELQSWIEFKLR